MGVRILEIRQWFAEGNGGYGRRSSFIDEVYSFHKQLPGVSYAFPPENPVDYRKLYTNV